MRVYDRLVFSKNAEASLLWKTVVVGLIPPAVKRWGGEWSMFYFKDLLIIGSPLFTLIIFMTRGPGRSDVYGQGKEIKNSNIKECSSMSVPKHFGSNISLGLILSICCGIGKRPLDSFCSGGSIMTLRHTTVSRWAVVSLSSLWNVTDCRESTRRTMKRMFHCKGSPTSTVRGKYRWRCRRSPAISQAQGTTKGSLIQGMQGKTVSRQRKCCQRSWCTLLTCNIQAIP